MNADHKRQDSSETGERRAKTAFAAMALLSVLAGLLLYLLQGRLGITEDTARLVSTTFLAVGIADTLVLLFWDRLFKRQR